MQLLSQNYHVVPVNLLEQMIVNLGVTLKSQPSPIPAMDTLKDPSAQSPRLEISIFVLSVAFVFAFFKLIVLDDGERPVPLRVTIPEQCSPGWKGEVLVEPTIKALLFPSALFYLS